MTAPRHDLGAGGVRGIGVDAVDVVRFRRVIERRPGIVDRLFTETEQAYAQRSRDPGPRLAVRFAAKLASATLDKAGAVIEGSTTQVVDHLDVWTFTRQLGARDPNWLLAATETVH